MKCFKCHADKLSREFPPTAVSDDCDHPALVCLRCVISHVKEHSACPEPECGVKVDENSGTVKFFEAILQEMFTVYESTDEPDMAPLSDCGEVVNIVVLNGESMQVPYNSSLTVMRLKKEIQAELNHETSKQKLLYKDKELKVFTDDFQYAKLSQYDVKPSATIHLVILLLSVPEGLNHVVFDLNWNYPVTGRDFLDASCFVFQGTKFLEVYDFRLMYYQQYDILLDGVEIPTHCLKAIEHFGDDMDEKKKIGHHKIEVWLKNIPAYVTHLFFTLSCFKSPTLAKFPNPSLRLYEAANASTDLCTTTFTHAKDSQAVVMCSVSKNEDGVWQIFDSGKTSAGNAGEYTHLERTLRTLVLQGF